MSHGFLILDKPTGMSSAQAVGEVKRMLRCKKIGHGGTLDPLASGILPLAIGEATKAFDYIASSIKSYRFTIHFGQERSTDDAEGEVTASTTTIPTRAEIEAVLPSFCGRIQQVPPAYSALKVDGKRAYALARAGQEVVLEAREIEVHSLVLQQFEGAYATLEVSCGKGTYVRSLARDIARKVNSLGYVSMLRRTAVGKFNESQAISLEKCRELVHSGALFKAWVTLELALDDIPAIEVDAQQASKLRQGQSIAVDAAEGRILVKTSGQVLAFAEVEEGRLRPVRVLNV